MIDSHCHLDHCEAPDGEVVERAVAAGVRRLATVGIDDASIERALAAAYAHEEVFAIVGRHPHEAEGLRVVSVLLHPFLPDASERLLAALGRGDLSLEGAEFGQVGGGARVEELEPLFPRVERAEA